MPESPLDSGPYEVLGVAADASADELRRAYRRALRSAHPDAGGTATAFVAVQAAWERVGTDAARAAYDAGRPAPDAERTTWAPAAPAPRRDSRPRARSSGHPGGWYRERYLALLNEWVGRGEAIPDPYDATLVRRAPIEVRRLLAAAIVEEDSARSLALLGVGFTLWHDVATPEGKLDHVVLGPTGLWAVQSEDFEGPVGVRRGELVAAGLGPGARPVHEVVQRARAIGRSAHLRFSAVVVVAPDDQAEGVTTLGRVRGIPTLLCSRSRLVDLLRTGLPEIGIGGTDLFEARSRLQAAIRFA